MELETILVWSILAVVVILFASDRLPADAVALAGLLALVAIGSLQAEQALAGFSSTAVVTIASLLVLSAALERTGVVGWIADRLHQWAGNSERRMLLAGTVAPGILSGMINIVATVLVFIPILLRLSLKANQSPGRVLLPMAYVAMAGANLTLIGASHNLVVNDLLSKRTDTDFGLFEFSAVGVVMMVVATLYVLLTVRWLLPERAAETDDEPLEQTRELIQRYDFSERIWELEVMPDSPLVATAISDLRLEDDYGLSLISLIRTDHTRAHLDQSAALEAGDIMLVGGRRERVAKLADNSRGLELRGAPAHREDFSAGSAELIEVMVPPRSSVIGKSIRDLDLRSQSDLTAIALWRDSGPLRTDAQTTALQAGDAVLLYGDVRYTRGFEPEPDFHWLHPPQKDSVPPEARRKGIWTLGIFLLVILAAAFDWFPIAVLALAGALAVTVLGALRAEQAYRRIDWRTVVLIAAMLPFATALNNSGASTQLAQWLIDTLSHWGPLAVMGAIATLTLLLTQTLHNAAAAAVMTPIALDSALQLGANPKSFAVAVVVAASMSVLLPVGHPAPLLVREYGKYRTRDYLRFGAGLAVLTLVVILVCVPWLWPLTETAA